MAIPIIKGKPQTSMGRRLFAQAAPIVGGAVGGPAGAALGSMIGSKVGGASGQEAILGGAQAGVENAMGRRQKALSDDPQVSISEGLKLLEELDPSHPLKQELGPGFLRASMMKKPGGWA